MHARHPGVRGVTPADLMQREHGPNKGKIEEPANQANQGNGPVTVHGDPPAKGVPVTANRRPPLKRRDVRAGNG